MFVGCLYVLWLVRGWKRGYFEKGVFVVCSLVVCLGIGED